VAALEQTTKIVMPRHDLDPGDKTSGTVPIFRSGTVRRMVGEKNGTVPLSQDVLSRGSCLDTWFAGCVQIQERNHKMSNEWFGRFRDGRELPYVNKATTWKAPVEAAIVSFNRLSLGVRLVPAKEEKDALIAFVLANGPTKYPFPGGVAETKPDFKPDGLHGQTAAQIDKRNKIYFAAVFLPGKVDKTTKEQREMVVVHEIIHACGMDEHDTEGIMYDKFRDAGSGLIELEHPEGAKGMPPIRVGGMTSSIMRKLWPPKDPTP
jgi:hypothetical protein